MNKISYAWSNKDSNKNTNRKSIMSRNKDLLLGILLAIILLTGISLMPVAGGANWEEIAKNSTLKIAILGDPTEIKESLIKSANASNIYTSADLNSDIFEQVNIIFINSSYLKNLQGTEGKEAIASRLDALAHSGKTIITIGSNPEVLYEYVKPNSMFIDLSSHQDVVALGVMIFPDNTSAGKFTVGSVSQAAGEMFIWVVETVQMREENSRETPVSTAPVAQQKELQDKQKAAALTREEKAKAIEIAISDPKVKESLPIDAEVIAVEIPQFAGENDKIYNVIFKHGEFYDTITVNLTSGKVENSVSIRGEYQPKIEDLPMPFFREDVIIYFKEMPESLDEFASRYDVKLIFAKQDIKLAAFETVPIGRPAQTSKRTLDFINEVSKDSRVEKAYKDEFEFIRPDEKYSPEPELMYPEDMKDEYVPNKVIVGFWRRPPSLEDFASNHGGKLTYYEEVLMFAGFEVSNISEFISKVSTDPYVRYAHPDGIGSIFGSPSGDLGGISGEAEAPKVPGFEAIFTAGFLISMVYIMKRGKPNG